MKRMRVIQYLIMTLEIGVILFAAIKAVTFSPPIPNLSASRAILYLCFFARYYDSSSEFRIVLDFSSDSLDFSLMLMFGSRFPRTFCSWFIIIFLFPKIVLGVSTSWTFSTNQGLLNWRKSVLKFSATMRSVLRSAFSYMSLIFILSM